MMNATPEPTAESRQLVVFRVRRDTRCTDCGVELERGQLLRVEGERALCLVCADLDQLEYLHRGDAALTRRARAHSTLQAVVVEWSRSRQRYERQGVLIESAALVQAENECLSDAEIRDCRRQRAAARRDTEDIAYVAAFASSIRAEFPGCPPEEASQIAEHACRRSSGRVGRSAAARAFDPEAVRLAVRAHVRHVHTPYDRLLAQSGDRLLARDQVRERVERILSDWQA
jgi:hypothetical protein